MKRQFSNCHTDFTDYLKLKKEDQDVEEMTKIWSLKNRKTDKSFNHSWKYSVFK